MFRCFVGPDRSLEGFEVRGQMLFLCPSREEQEGQATRGGIRVLREANRLLSENQGRAEGFTSPKAEQLWLTTSAFFPGYFSWASQSLGLGPPVIRRNSFISSWTLRVASTRIIMIKDDKTSRGISWGCACPLVEPVQLTNYHTDK